MTGSEPVMICNVWHVIARLSPAEEEESSEVRLWRKLCFGTTTCLFSDWVSRSLFYLQHLIRVCTVCISVPAYLIISTSLSTNNFLLRLSKQYHWLKPTLLSPRGDYYFVRKVRWGSVMLLICLIFLWPKVRECGVGAGWSTLDMSLHCIPPTTEIFPSQCWLSDISISTSPPPLLLLLTNCLAHSLLFALHHFLNSITPRRSSFTCLLLALTVSGDKHTPAEQMTSLIIISPSQEFVFNITHLTDRIRVCLVLSSTTS